MYDGFALGNEPFKPVVGPKPIGLTFTSLPFQAPTIPGKSVGIDICRDHITTSVTGKSSWWDVHDATNNGIHRTPLPAVPNGGMPLSIQFVTTNGVLLSNPSLSLVQDGWVVFVEGGAPGTYLAYADAVSPTGNGGVTHLTREAIQLINHPIGLKFRDVTAMTVGG
jgi:hypothetical protein